MIERFDVVIIGGAIMGSAVAYFLSESPDFTGRILVLEKDRSYATAASSLSTSGVRQQFSSSINIELSQFTVEFLRQADLRLAVDGASAGVRFQENGYLYLGAASAIPSFEANNALQRSMGVNVELLGPNDLQARFPWLTLDDVAIGSLGLTGEGWTDGYMLMMAFKAKARASGVEYRYAKATDLVQVGNRITGVRCNDGAEFSAAHVVNVAGGGGRQIARLAGVDLPVRRVKQIAFAFESPFHMHTAPYVLTPDRLFFRPEGKHYISGQAVDIDFGDDEDDLSVGHDVFVDEVWPKLAFRVAGFEKARLISSWAGHYDMNLFDHNAIVGRVDGLQGFYIANGFSGHGVMQAPGIGRGLAELIIYNRYKSLDLTALGFGRIAAGQPLREYIQY